MLTAPDAYTSLPRGPPIRRKTTSHSASRVLGLRPTHFPERLSTQSVAAPVGPRRHTDHLVEGPGKGRHRLVADRLGHFGHRLAVLEQPARLAHAQVAPSCTSTSASACNASWSAWRWRCWSACRWASWSAPRASLSGRPPPAFQFLRMISPLSWMPIAVMLPRLLHPRHPRPLGLLGADGHGALDRRARLLPGRRRPRAVPALEPCAGVMRPDPPDKQDGASAAEAPSSPIQRLHETGQLITVPAGFEGDYNHDNGGR